MQANVGGNGCGNEENEKREAAEEEEWGRRSGRNVQKGLLTRQYLNNTELSPNEQKKEKETIT